MASAHTRSGGAAMWMLVTTSVTIAARYRPASSSTASQSRRARSIAASKRVQAHAEEAGGAVVAGQQVGRRATP